MPNMNVKVSMHVYLGLAGCDAVSFDAQRFELNMHVVHKHASFRSDSQKGTQVCRHMHEDNYEAAVELSTV
jgi:hypothetical protein